jgi:ParB-like chromosome segregation protein Spo0J
MSIDAIVVGQRHRRDLGDVTGLAASVKELGLLQPIGVSPDGHLLFGERRLAACRLAGLADVPVHIVSDLDSAAAKLMAERDENTCRKDMTPEELVSLGRALEAVERPRARERQERLGRTHGDPLGSVDPKGKTYDIVGSALGVSGATYKRAKAVVNAAEDTDAPEEVREVAQAALAEMNETGKVTPAYDKVRRAQAGAGSKADRASHPRLHHKKAASILPRFLGQISGIAAAIDGVDFCGCRLDQGQLSELDASVRVILAARKSLRGNSE